MATKTIYICDYCGREMSDCGSGVKIVMFRRGSTVLERGWADLCSYCAEHIQSHIDEAVNQLGDNSHED